MFNGVMNNTYKIEFQDSGKWVEAGVFRAHSVRGAYLKAAVFLGISYSDFCELFVCRHSVV